MSQMRDRVLPVPWQLTGTMRSTMFAKILWIRLKFVSGYVILPCIKWENVLMLCNRLHLEWKKVEGTQIGWLGWGAQKRSRLGKKDGVWIWTHCLWGSYEITSWRGKPVFRSMDAYLKRRICTWYAELRFISFGKRGSPMRRDGHWKRICGEIPLSELVLNRRRYRVRRRKWW